jgi:hypothetical protein
MIKYYQVTQKQIISFLSNALLLSVSLLVVMGIITFYKPVSFTTSDDYPHLLDYLEEQPLDDRVLGAQSEFIEQAGCSEDKPVIGWIDYQGQKIIVNSLPEGKIASVCFSSVDEANEQGYFQRE